MTEMHANAVFELVKGRAGVFDIEIDGVLVYSKNETGRFPTDAEIRAL